MDDRHLWIARRNVVRFEQLLAFQTDEPQRSKIAKLLAEAKQIAAEIELRLDEEKAARPVWPSIAR